MLSSMSLSHSFIYCLLCFCFLILGSCSLLIETSSCSSTAAVSLLFTIVDSAMLRNYLFSSFLPLMLNTINVNPTYKWNEPEASLVQSVLTFLLPLALAFAYLYMPSPPYMESEPSILPLIHIKTMDTKSNWLRNSYRNHEGKWNEQY